MTLRSAALAATALLTLTAAPAFATSTKTWVSSTGTDTGGCPLAAPCRTFQYAYSQTTAGGEIDVKDTGSYGSLAITQAVSVVSGDGILAAVGASQGGTSITINAGPNDVILLSGLNIDGHGIGHDGVDFNTGQVLTIENCHIRNFISNAVLLKSPISVISSEISNSDTGLSVGTGTKPPSYVESTFVHDNSTGISVFGTVTISDSSVIRNSTGIAAYRTAYINNTTVINNSTGVYVDAGGVANTYGNNRINANGSYDVFGSLTPVRLQ